jgi:hypothetical protein
MRNGVLKIGRWNEGLFIGILSKLTVHVPLIARGVRNAVETVLVKSIL